jgi:hypothetical protein
LLEAANLQLEQQQQKQQQQQQLVQQLQAEVADAKKKAAAAESAAAAGPAAAAEAAAAAAAEIERLNRHIKELKAHQQTANSAAAAEVVSPPQSHQPFPSPKRLHPLTRPF